VDVGDSVAKHKYNEGSAKTLVHPAPEGFIEQGKDIPQV